MPRESAQRVLLLLLLIVYQVPVIGLSLLRMIYMYVNVAVMHPHQVL